MTIGEWVNKLSSKEHKRLIRKIETKKYGRLIGEGGFANVYKFGDDKVLRWEPNRTYNTALLSDYRYYVERVVLRNRSKYLPKVFFHAYTGTGVITILERLYESGDEGNTLSRKYLSGYSTWEITKDGGIEKRVVRGIDRMIGKIAQAGLEADDIHSGNLMKRKNGDIVLTDPCA